MTGSGSDGHAAAPGHRAPDEAGPATGLWDGLLAGPEIFDRDDPLEDRLSWLVRHAAASGGRILLGHGRTAEVVASVGPVPSPDGPDETDRSVLRIDLGSLRGEVAELLLSFEEADIPEAIRTEAGRIGAIFRLLLERRLDRRRIGEYRERLALHERLGSDWLWETDADGRLTRLSRDPRRLGIDPGLLHGRLLQDIAAGPDAADASAGKALRKAIRARKPFADVVHPLPTASGGTIWLRSRGVPRFARDGTFLGYTGVSTEVTELVEREEAERASAERLAAFLRALPHLSLEITADGRFTDFIAGPKSLLVCPRDSLPGKLIEEVLPPDVAALARKTVDEVMATGGCAPVRYRLETASGLRWFSLTGARKAPVAPGGEPTAIFVIADVTEDAAATEQLFRLSTIVEAMTNMVVIVDPEGRITWANAAWEERFGWRLDEVRGRGLADLVRPPGADPQSAEAVAAAIAEGKRFRGETVNRDRHGNRFWIDFNILPMRDLAGAIVGYVSVETDITALRESRQQAAEAAAAAEAARARLHNALEALPDGVVIWDETDRLVDVNPAYKRMYPHVAELLVPGVTQEEVLRKGLERRAFPSAWGREEEWLAEQWERYRSPTVDEVQRADGRWLRRLDLRTADGGRIAVRIDVTERRERMEALDRANKALAEAQDRLTMTLKHAEVGAWEWQIDAGAVAIAGAYATMLGYDAEEFRRFSYERFRTLVHPEDLARLDASDPDSYRPRAAGLEPMVEQVFRMRHRNGAWVWILSRSAVTERFPDGRPKRIVGIHLDITERRRLEEEILERQRLLAGVMDASASAIALVSNQGQIHYANAEAEKLLELRPAASGDSGYEPADWTVETLDGRPLPVEEWPFRRALDQKASVRDFRLALVWPDGRRRILSVNANPKGDDASVAVTSFIDITQELERAEQLELALAQAREASRAKSDFLANMSHEIRTPLNGVLGMAEILDGLITDPRQKDMIGTIRRSGELLLDVLNDILDMSKIEAGKMVLESIPFVPAELAHAAERLYQLKAEEKGLGFEVFVNSAASGARCGDPLRIQQILNNLLSNAIKFTERGWVALVVSARPGQPLVFEVRDTGIGMTAEQQSRVFASFEQAEAGTTRRFGGTGLGMAIVKRLVDLMGGTIEIRSAPGQGTDIRILLPLPEAPEAAPEASAADETAASADLSGRRLLIADDSETNRRVIEEMLKDSGAELRFASNGALAVEAFERMVQEGTPPDVLVLDIAMPVMDGKEALATIRRLSDRDHPVPAVAVTANAMAHQVAEYMMAGFDAHVPKPFRRAELLGAIAALLRDR